MRKMLDKAAVLFKRFNPLGDRPIDGREMTQPERLGALLEALKTSDRVSMMIPYYNDAVTLCRCLELAGAMVRREGEVLHAFGMQKKELFLDGLHGLRDAYAFLCATEKLGCAMREGKRGAVVSLVSDKVEKIFTDAGFVVSRSYKDGTVFMNWPKRPASGGEENV